MREQPNQSHEAGAVDAAGAVVGLGGRAHTSETTARHRCGALAHRTRRSLSRPGGGGGQRVRGSRRRSAGVQHPTGPTAAQPRAGRRIRCRDGGGVRRPVRSVGLLVRGRRRALLPAQSAAGRCHGPGREPRAADRQAGRGGGRLRATVRGPRIPHREPGPSRWEPLRTRPGRCGQLGGDVAGASGVRSRHRPRIRNGSSGSRTSTSSVGSGREDSTCWSTPCRLGPWPTNRRRPAAPRLMNKHRPTDEREPWRCLLPRPELHPPRPATRPPFVALVACGLLGPASAKGHREAMSARPFSTASGMASGVASERTQTTAGPWGSSPRNENPVLQVPPRDGLTPGPTETSASSPRATGSLATKAGLTGMCGIAGILDPAASTSADRLGALASSHGFVLEHRGPDDSGVWVDADAGVAFGHRRLAVIDLGAGGAQPMVSSGGRWVMAYNGEIYNHARGPASIGTCRDRSSEVVPTQRCWSQRSSRWGVDRALDACEGMFAVALWDRRDRELHLLA